MSDFLEELDEQIRKAKEEKDLLEIRRESLIEELSHLHAVRRNYFEGMRNAAIAAIGIATKMIEDGLDDELISEMTELSLEEVIEIKIKNVKGEKK